MLTLFLVCLIIGGGLLAFSLLSGTHDSNTIEHSGELQLETDADLHPEITPEHSFSAEHSVESSPEKIDAIETVKFFSLRNFIYFLTFFGLTGTILTLANINSILSLITSIGIGGLSYFFGYKLMKYFKSSETGEIVNIYNLVGRTGRVELDIKNDKKGKIVVNVGGRLVELVAVRSESSEQTEFRAGEQILITEIQDNIAIVDKKDF